MTTQSHTCSRSPAALLTAQLGLQEGQALLLPEQLVRTLQRPCLRLVLNLSEWFFLFDLLLLLCRCRCPSPAAAGLQAEQSSLTPHPLPLLQLPCRWLQQEHEKTGRSGRSTACCSMQHCHSLLGVPASSK
jgi:hypothetical protein